MLTKEDIKLIVNIATTALMTLENPNEYDNDKFYQDVLDAYNEEKNN